MTEPQKPEANKSRTISASEINRFIYCNYQWYYERFYGRQYIRKLCNERNAELGLNDSSLSKFSRGNEFHKNYLSGRRRAFLLKLSAVVIILLVGLAVTYFMLYIEK